MTAPDDVVAGLDVAAGPAASPPPPPPTAGLTAVPGVTYCPGTPGKIVAVEVTVGLTLIGDRNVSNIL